MGGIHQRINSSRDNHPLVGSRVFQSRKPGLNELTDCNAARLFQVERKKNTTTKWTEDARHIGERGSKVFRCEPQLLVMFCGLVGCHMADKQSCRSRFTIFPIEGTRPYQLGKQRLVARSDVFRPVTAVLLSGPGTWLAGY